MVLSKEGTLYHRKDGKYFLYIPTDMTKDSQFPFQNIKKGETQKVMIHVSTVQGILIVTPIEVDVSGGKG